MDIDFDNEPLGHGQRRPARLPARHLALAAWRSKRRSAPACSRRCSATKYADVFTGDDTWRNLDVPDGRPLRLGPLLHLRPQAPLLRRHDDGVRRPRDIHGARALGVFGDSVTTDHISPAGEIVRNSPAGRYLTENDVPVHEYNTFGARRGNHEVMGRGTFGNIRLKNALVPGVEGWFTRHLPDGEEMSIWDASQKYQAEGVPLIVLGGKEYGTGSSRDWAAKGPKHPRRQGRHRRELRAHPPQQPHRHGRAAAAVRARRVDRRASASRAKRSSTSKASPRA